MSAYISKKVKQGCLASSYVFCLFLDRVWDFIAAHTTPVYDAHTRYLALLATIILLYVYDIVLIANSLRQLQ